ncbi:hypothetical protein DFP72DRAFT_919668 [Ephemerocybe angulata]|uniref:NmrA-like domain-containing protein n=1 Tax=Ephemerocybe angulata TaxID=980116 RepID=A0A8H6HIB1_9AGAR|nr:hypothetical protein DFP72DRAFT_919668 [Tulosesus angulatus]
MSTTKILITGATGYIGGSVLGRLLVHPESKSFEIVALVRSAEKAAKISTLGVETVVGDYDNLALLTELASNADVVFEIVDCDRLPPNEALIQGAKQRFEATGKAPILIHTSGSALIMDDAHGLHGNHKVYSDLQSDEIEALPDTALHRNVDLAYLKADKEGFAKAYIVTPGCVWGLAKGPLVDLGVQHTQSMLIPYLLKAAIARKQAGYIGLGKNIWPLVSNADTADLYIIVFNAIRKNPDTVGHGRDGFYFAENGEFTMYEASQAVGKALKELGILDSDEATPFSEEEALKYLGPYWFVFGTNSLSRGERSRAVGWKPVDGKDDFLASIKADLVEVLKASPQK